MGIEIERKFLVTGSDWRRGASATCYRQGYLNTDPGRSVRIRLAGDKGVLTIKGKTEGAERLEFEYSVPQEDAEQMLATLCRKPLIEKDRYRVRHAGLTWEVDVFHGENAGLVLAEVELASSDQEIDLPPWVGEEVTSDRRYFNLSLVQYPYSAWRENTPEKES
ncbi:MAG TPA: CYTH domain-containing protein [Desulfuromonadales bacterium]|nr:CYTH domain-containing protein [Desulfuromonadales bacterium]